MSATRTETGESPDPITRRELDFEISGMTCASCAARIERNLNRLDGIDASVNYATEKARVKVPEGLAPEEIIAEVEKTGYSAALPPDSNQDGTGRDHAGHSGGHDHGGIAGPETDREIEVLRQRLIGSILLAVPVIAMSMF
nr:heavy metal-associated domain-containing protein [Solirubrobacterales bacterium]